VQRVGSSLVVALRTVIISLALSGSASYCAFSGACRSRKVDMTKLAFRVRTWRRVIRAIQYPGRG
jgi:hypothetical protein